jgi:protoporphyrinogen oxidase
MWGADCVVFEADSAAGGHARSDTKDGFLWDRGPHMMFSKDKAVLEFMVRSLGENVHRCRRNNVVKVAGATLQYPLENDLGQLPDDLVIACLADFVDARLALAEADVDQSANLDEWFTAHFGEALTDLYFRPYNEKVWKIPLRDLSMIWSDRIPNPPVRDVIKGALGQKTDGYVHQLFYNYPRQGGFGALMKSWSDALAADQLRVDERVTALRPVADGVVVAFSDGRSETFTTVISTLPLPVLCARTEGCPAEIRELAESLIVNPMVIANYGFMGVDENEFTAVYIPDADFGVNRVSFPAVYSPMNAPAGHFLVQAEITAPPGGDVMTWSDDDVNAHVLAGLRSRGIAPETEPVMVSIERYERAYIVYDAGYQERLAPVLAWFRARGIYPHGRFGSHNYLNVDGCVRQSVDLAAELGRPHSDDEVASFFPATSEA